jgi:hypothetical protein
MAMLRRPGADLEASSIGQALGEITLDAIED